VAQKLAHVAMYGSSLTKKKVPIFHTRKITVTAFLHADEASKASFSSEQYYNVLHRQSVPAEILQMEAKFNTVKKSKEYTALTQECSFSNKFRYKFLANNANEPTIVLILFLQELESSLMANEKLSVWAKRRIAWY
jgi:hypothetical protein